MAGYYDEEEYGTGPYRPPAAQFDTMNMGPGPQRVEQFDTANLGAAPAPHRVPQFDTMNLGAPVRAQEPANMRGGKLTAGDGRNAAYSTDPALAPGGYTAAGGGHTPMNPALETQSKIGSGGRMPSGLVIASLCLRVATVVTLIIGVAVLASDSETVASVASDLQTVVYITVSFSAFAATKYALAAAIIGAIYSIYETVSAGVRLAMGHLLLPGRLSLFVSYIGDQVVIVLLLTGASAAATIFNEVTNLVSCGSYCKQGGGAVAMIFLGSFFLAASLIISSYCFYKRKI